MSVPGWAYDRYLEWISRSRQPRRRGCIRTCRHGHQRAGVEILHKTLPTRYDVVITVRLSETQRLLYNDALERQVPLLLRTTFLP